MSLGFDFIYFAKTTNSLTIIRPEVTKVYFAEAKIEEVEMENTSGVQGNEIYTVISGDNISKIANKKGTTVSAIIESDTALTDANKGDLIIGQKITLPNTVATAGKKKKITFEKINKGTIGKAIYVIVETKRLNGYMMSISVRQGIEDCIVEKDAEIMLKDDQEKYHTWIKTKVGGICDTDYINKDDFIDKAIFKIAIDTYDKDIKAKWIKAIGDTQDKKTSLYIIADATFINDQEKLNINYLGDTEEGEVRGEKIKNRWLDVDGQWFELKKLEKKICPIDPKNRSHFVIHCTAGAMTESSIKFKTKFDIPGKKKRSAAHIYVNLDGTKFEVWPLTEKNVWATKIESKKGLNGQMFHIELNYGSPTKPSEAQYITLADLYIESSEIEKCWPIIVPHIEVDRGIADGHQDPTDFDYNHFYSILKLKGVPIDEISKFDHDRYWGDKTYKVPWGSDKTEWPPILSGNPHK
ncbi:N-acetylmuramoyl-L-alanine amidase [Cellulophaga algicola]|uniref:N-acetylmuramoyl-L-alanine amidase n=1 Tax=Cellulophaga algicola TaxID=59600 RepID=UPI00031576CE|nr:N-acetylmuramoyl-L-alanine amidase [Cellulophaga algicola]